MRAAIYNTRGVWHEAYMTRCISCKHIHPPNLVEQINPEQSNNEMHP